jgi:hypothetical protein
MFCGDGFPKPFCLQGKGDGTCANILVGIHHNHDLFSVRLPGLDGGQEIFSEGSVGFSVWVGGWASAAKVELVLVVYL